LFRLVCRLRGKQAYTPDFGAAIRAELDRNRNVIECGGMKIDRGLSSFEIQRRLRGSVLE